MQVHPAQISPAETFDLFYFLRNHTDATTYYVRAVVYDVRTGETLATVPLAQSATNSRLFITTVQAPADPVGIGRNIVAIATVYTDSAYTTKSQDYEEQEQYFLIKNSTQLIGGGGGVDLRPFQEWLREELDRRFAALPQPQPFPEMPFDAIFGAIGKLQESINRIPKDATDLAPVLAAIVTVQQAIAALPEPKDPEKPDLSPVTTAIANVQKAVENACKDTATVTTKALTTNSDALRAMGDKLLTDVSKGLQDFIRSQELTIPLNRLLQDKPKEEPLPDLSHLM